jgi:hypothetical protein
MAGIYLNNVYSVNRFKSRVRFLLGLTSKNKLDNLNPCFYRPSFIYNKGPSFIGVLMQHQQLFERILSFDFI